MRATTKEKLSTKFAISFYIRIYTSLFIFIIFIIIIINLTTEILFSPIPRVDNFSFLYTNIHSRQSELNNKMESILFYFPFIYVYEYKEYTKNEETVLKKEEI